MKAIIQMLLLGMSGIASATPTSADYARSIGLREAWSGLTRDVAFPAQWRSDGQFYYRKTVEGGFAFVLGDPADPSRTRPAFDAETLADPGFIVVQIDGMGTAHRSKAFHDVAWKNLGDSGFPDRIAWHRALAERDRSYDITRVGIYGASAGGQSTLNALLFHPEFYRVGVALAGCYDNRMDKISWNEQWLGWPVDESYARASGVVHAHRLQGQLLLIVGEQDRNVDPASTAQVVDALIRADKEFELLSIPGGEHSAGRSSGPIDYVTRRLSRFFVRHLQGQE